MRKYLVLLIVLSANYGAHAKTEFGKLKGAEFRIDVPDNWNHGLVAVRQTRPPLQLHSGRS